MRFLLVVALAWLGACTAREKKYVKAYTDLDSLVNAQITALKEEQQTLKKRAWLNQLASDTAYRPDSLAWTNELSIFRQLDAINKPTFRGAYVRETGTDSKSNLAVLSLTSNKPSTVPYIRFYYLNKPANLKRVEARFEESNALFSTYRQMEMQFEEINGQTLLKSFRVEGAQKMMLSDSVRFGIEATVQR